MNILLCTGQRINRPKRPRLWAAEPSLRDPATHSKAPAGPELTESRLRAGTAGRCPLGGSRWVPALRPARLRQGFGAEPQTPPCSSEQTICGGPRRTSQIEGSRAADKGFPEGRGKVCSHRHEASGCGLVAEVPPADGTSKPRPEGQEGAGPGGCAENFLGRWGSNCEDLRKEGARYV